VRDLAALFGLAVVAAAAQQPQVFRTETRIVLIDAVATNKKGDPVRDLTAKDFRIWEDHKEQTIRSFSLETDATAEPGRFILFFDNSSMSVGDQASVRQAAASFIDAVAAPNRLMAVVEFTEGFRVAQSFTDNPERLKQAVHGLRIEAQPSSTGPSGYPITAPGGASPPSARQALVSLARNLSATPGRKTLILFTGGTLFAGAAVNDLAGMIETCNRSNIAVYPVVQRTDSSARSTVDLSTAEGNGGFRRPRVAPALTLAQDDSGSYTLASGTGGFVVPRSNDLVAKLLKIGEEQTQHYVLGYDPSGPSKPEACHALRVKVDRGGVKLRVRSSYCAVKPQDLLAESRTEQDLEKRAAAPQAGDRAAEMQAPFFYVSSNLARVHVVMELPTNELKFDSEKGKLHSEVNVLGIASTPDGGITARFSDVVQRNFNNPQEVVAFKEKPLSYEKDFKIVPGEYNLTVVFSSGGASFGKAEAPLRVPAYDPGKFAVSGVALGKQVRPAADLGLQASLTEGSTPLIANGMQLIPSGSNRFNRSEQAFCYFEVYTPSAERASIRVRILAGNATPWDGGEATVGPAAHGNVIPIGFSLPIAMLPSGSYEIEVTARDEMGQTVKVTAPIAIN
jgi:VWFA-related protein